jgi:hypothetical protein
MSRPIIAIIVAIIAGTAAHAERLVRSPLMPSGRSLFLSPYAPAEAVTCEERYESVCARPCKTWAGAQPDFEFSYDICVAKCPRPIRGTCR